MGLALTAFLSPFPRAKPIAKTLGWCTVALFEADTRRTRAGGRWLVDSTPAAGFKPVIEHAAHEVPAQGVSVDIRSTGSFDTYGAWVSDGGRMNARRPSPARPGV